MAPAGDGHGGRHSADEGATDQARIGYLSGDEDVLLDAADQAELDELRALLADPTLWAEPPAALEDSVVGLIAAESAGARRTDLAGADPDVGNATDVAQAAGELDAAGPSRDDRPV